MKNLEIKPMRLLEIIVCLVLSWWAYPQFTKGLRLPEEVYSSSSYLLGSFQLPFFTAVIIIAFVMFLLDRIPNTRFYDSLSWQGMEQGKALRLVIGISSLAIAWKFSNNDYNYYLNQAHVLERIVLLVLWGLIFAHPVFVPVFVAYAMIVINQLWMPYGTLEYTLTDKSLLIAILVMFSGWLLVRLFTRSRTSTLVFLWLCVIGAHYIIPGQSKLALGNQPWDWLLYNQLDNLFIASYTQGWLGFLSEDTALQIASIVRVLNFPLQLGTVITELGIIFIAFNRKVTIGMLLIAIAMHIGIVLSSGIFFWKWIVFEVALIAFLATRDDEWLKTLYNPVLFGLSFFIILLSGYFSYAVPLGWFDTKISHVYHIEAVTTTGEVYDVSPTVMEPFDIIFSQNRLFFLDPRFIASGTYGTIIGFEDYMAIRATTSPEEAYALEEEIGRQIFHAGYVGKFNQFMQRYFMNLNAIGERRTVLPFLPSTPQHILTMYDNPYRVQAPVAELHIYAEHSYYHDGQLFVEDPILLRIIQIPQAE